MQGTLVGICVVVASVVAPLGMAAGIGQRGSATASVAVRENTPPLADAGLDQTARAGETVRLDATASRDPDGSLASYDWTITTPNGTVFDPACGDCGRTRFVPAREGRYSVTVTVTDDHGATSSDTLYVDVNGTLLSASLTGPTTPAVGVERTYRIELSEQRRVETVHWRTNRSLSREVAVERTVGTVSETIQFRDDQPRLLTARVRTTDGRVDRATLVVRPRARSDGASGQNGCGVACDAFHARNGNQFASDDGTTGYESHQEAVSVATSPVPFLDPDIGESEGGNDGNDRSGGLFPW